MTNQQILEKAIQKAIDGGWVYYINKFEYAAEYGAVLEDYKFNQWYTLFTDHDFAKALWGETTNTSGTVDGRVSALNGWQYHLQQMVISEDPIKYLGENL